MTDYIMTAAEIADMNRDIADNADANWRVQSMIAADKDYLNDYSVEGFDFAEETYDGPDMCIYCDAEVFGTSCSICSEYKGVVSWSDYEKRV